MPSVWDTGVWDTALWDDPPPEVLAPSSVGAGLNAGMYLVGGAGPVGATDTLPMLTGIHLSWTVEKRSWRDFGSLRTTDVLDGKISFEGDIEHAFVTAKYMGSFDAGTYDWVGSIMPRGGTNPAIGGTIKFIDGRLTGMDASNNGAIYEDLHFIIYNLTFVD